MTHAQKPDLVFQRNGRVHLNWPGGVLSVQSTAAQSRCAHQRTASVLSLASTLITAWKCRYKTGRSWWRSQFVMCGCVYVCGFCDVWVCVCVAFVMCGCVYVWLL